MITTTTNARNILTLPKLYLFFVLLQWNPTTATKFLVLPQKDVDALQGEGSIADRCTKKK